MNRCAAIALAAGISGRHYLSNSGGVKLRRLQEECWGLVLVRLPPV